MQRVRIQIGGIADLDYLAQIHYGYTIGNVLNNGEAMGDEKIRQAKLLLQFLEQIYDLSLDRNVKCRDRFITNDQLWIKCQSPSDPDPLTLAARKLMRVAIGVFWVKAYLVEQVLNPSVAFTFVPNTVDLKRLRYDRADAHTRIEARVGILKDDLHLATKGLHLPILKAEEVLTIKHDLATRRLDQPQQTAANSRFAAS